MDGLQHGGWRRDDSRAIGEALGDLLDELEWRASHDCQPLPVDPLPISTGVPALDRVCGGGVHLGQVLLLEADQPAQAAAVACSIARQAPHAVLLDTPSVRAATRIVLAGAAQVPAVLIGTGQLDDRDWARLTTALEPLAGLDLRLGASGSIGELEHLVAVHPAPVVVVEAIERLGGSATVVHRLTELAAVSGLAIVGTCAPLGDLPDSLRHPVARVAMTAHTLGSGAALAAADEHDGLIVAQVAVDALHATVA